MNDNLDLSNALTIEIISQNNHVSSNHNDEPCDDNLIIVSGDIGHPPRRVTILVDCGASANFISKALIEKCQLKTAPLSQSHDVLMANGATQKCERFTEITVTIAGLKFPTQFKIIELKKYDMICGMPYLINNKIKLDFSSRKMVIKGKSIGFENQRVSCNSIVYTVDSDAQYPIISAKQVSKVLKKQDYSDLYVVHFNELTDLSSSEANMVLNPEDNTKISETEEIIKKLKEEFNDIFPEELPAGLPPEREVKHKIR